MSVVVDLTKGRYFNKMQWLSLLETYSKTSSLIQKCWIIWKETTTLTISQVLLMLFSFTINLEVFCLWVCQLTVCQPHNLWRERWGLLYYGLKPGHAEWGLKKRNEDRVGVDWWMVWKWVSWSVSSSIVNISPCTHPFFWWFHNSITIYVTTIKPMKKS